MKARNNQILKQTVPINNPLEQREITSSSNTNKSMKISIKENSSMIPRNDIGNTDIKAKFDHFHKIDQELYVNLNKNSNNHNYNHRQDNKYINDYNHEKINYNYYSSSNTSKYINKDNRQIISGSNWKFDVESLKENRGINEREKVKKDELLSYVEMKYLSNNYIQKKESNTKKGDIVSKINMLKNNQYKKSERSEKSKEKGKINDKQREVVLYQDSKRKKFNEHKKVDEMNRILKEKSIPKITNFSKRLVKERSLLFEERLYPFSNSLINEAINSQDQDEKKYINEYEKNTNSSQDLSQDKKERQIYTRNQWSRQVVKNENYQQEAKKINFSPSINSNSKKIANSLEPSFERLTRKKSKSSMKSGISHRSKNEQYASSTQSKTLTKNQSEGKLKTNTPKRIDRLYTQGYEKIRKINEETRLKNNQVELEKTPKKFKLEVSKSDLERYELFYKRNQDWRYNVNEKTKSNEKYEKDLIKKECSFSPSINKMTIQNDEKVIKRNANQIYDYVKRRRDFLKEKEVMKPVDASNKVFLISQFHQSENDSYIKSSNLIFETDKRIEEKRKRSNSQERFQRLINRRYVIGCEEYFN